MSMNRRKNINYKDYVMNEYEKSIESEEAFIQINLFYERCFMATSSSNVFRRAP